mgnify:CR=1 FL=1
MAVVAFNGAKTYYEESTTRLPLSKTSSRTISFWEISTPRPRSCTLSPRRPGPRSWCASWSCRCDHHRRHPEPVPRQADGFRHFHQRDRCGPHQAAARGADAKELQKIAKQIATAVTQELGIKVVIGIGTVVNHIRDLARATRRLGWPSTWARCLTPKRPSSTMRIWVSAV